jgi:hypothetical protein
MRLYGYNGSRAFLASQVNALMTTHLFALRAREAFFPAIKERWTEFGYTERTLFLLGGLRSHHTDEFPSVCTDRGIDVLFLVPNSSDKT